MALPTKNKKAPARIDFRGSIAWLSESLSTLRNGGYPTPRKTRFRVLVKLSRTGFHPQGSNKRFLHHIMWESSFSKLLGAILSSNFAFCTFDFGLRFPV
jgi:hypothetical protein